MKKFLLFDVVLQGITLAIILFSVLSFFIFNGGILFLALLAWMFLGFWQLLSSILVGFIFHQKNRRYYLLAVVGYFAIASILTLVANEFVSDYFYRDILMFFSWLLLPIPMAIWYFVATLRNMNPSWQPMPKSFWDIG